MGMGEFDRTCQIVRLCDTFCVLEAEIVHNARNEFGPNKKTRKFLTPVILAELATILEFNLAPLCTRRDIAMLGVIHRAILRLGPD